MCVYVYIYIYIYICLRAFCADSSSPQISAILVGHFTRENDSLRKASQNFHENRPDFAQKKSKPWLAEFPIVDHVLRLNRRRGVDANELPHSFGKHSLEPSLGHYLSLSLSFCISLSLYIYIYIYIYVYVYPPFCFAPSRAADLRCP